MAVTEEIQRKVLAEATSATPNYDIDYNDPRFGKVESDKNQALTELEQTYAGMIGNTDQYYDKQIQASKDWADKQTQLQQEQTDFAIEQINQQKDQAHKDYLKEQSASYVDFQKQSNKYGANAEQMASAGLWGSGFSESSQVGMYNTYQNRVASARETYKLAVQNYNNQITQARIQNNAVLAEIAYNALKEQLTYSLEGFQYKNNLILEQANKKVEMENMYYQRYQDVLNQINTENAFAEEIRQFQENMAFQEAENAKNREHDSAEAALDRQFQTKQAELERKFKADQAVLDRKHDKEILAAKNKHEKEMADRAHEQALAKLAKQHEYDKKLMAQELSNAKAKLKYQYDLEKSSSGGGGSSNGKVSYKNTMSGVGGSVNKATGKVTGDSDTSGNYERAKDYYNGMVAAGKTKAQVLSDITSAYKAGQLSKSDYNKLKAIFNVKGFEY